MNPYTPPQTESVPEAVDPEEFSNPAKPLLYFIGGMYAAFSPMSFLTGLQAGMHVIAGSLAMLVLGVATIWLGHRAYTRVCRLATVVWGSILSVFFVCAAVSTLAEPDVGGLLFFVFVLIIVVPIPVMAIRRQHMAATNVPVQRWQVKHRLPH